jgi:VIT1/CCC1 family predicted Fe2+/Mn2+ transporter
MPPKEQRRTHRLATSSSIGRKRAGTSGLVAGAMAMAARECFSVSSQADTERADLAIESKRLRAALAELVWSSCLASNTMEEEPYVRIRRVDESRRINIAES